MKRHPVANNDKFESHTESLDVLKNDAPANDADELKVAKFTQAEHGKVSLNEDGTINYTPKRGFSGVDKFQYAVTDGTQVSNAATVSVHVEKSLEVDAKSDRSGRFRHRN